MNAMRYRMVCHQMQIDAQTALSRGDSCKASEYGWGSAVQMVKAIAEDKGWRHLTDDQIVEAIDRIREETREPQIGLLFNQALALHFNFYENNRTHQAVADAIDAVNDLIGLLLRRFPPNY